MRLFFLTLFCLLSKYPSFSQQSDYSQIDTEELFIEAEKRYEVGDLNGAFDLYKIIESRSEEINPDDLFSSMANIQLHLGNIYEAVKFESLSASILSAYDNYMTTQEKNSKAKECYQNANKIALGSNSLNFKEALFGYCCAIAYNPSNFKYHLERGFAREALSDFSGALEDYNEAISLAPRNVTSYLLRGDLKQLHLDDYNGAIADYSIAITLAPDFLFYYRRAVSKGSTSDFAGAISDLKYAINIYSTTYRKDRLSIFSNSSSLSQQVIYPALGDAYYQSAKYKFKINDDVGACKDLSKAVDLGTSEAKRDFVDKCK